MELVFLAVHFREKAVDAEESCAGGGLVAVEEDFMLEGCEVLPGDVEGECEGLGVAAEVGEPGAVFGAVPGVDCAAEEGEGFVGDDEVDVEIDGVAEALTAGTCAEWVVEAEEAGFGFFGGEVAEAAFVGGGEAVEWAGGVRRWRSRSFAALRMTNFFWGWGGAGDFFEDDFAGFAVGDFDGVHDAGAVFWRDYDAVDQDEDGLGEVEVEEGFGAGELEDFFVLIEAVEAVGA